MCLTLASKARVIMQAMGDGTLIFPNNSLLVLTYCLYVLKSWKNLILVSSLCKYWFFYDKKVFTKMNDLFICSGSLIDSLYCLTLLFVLPSNENYHISHKRNIALIIHNFGTYA